MVKTNIIVIVLIVILVLLSVLLPYARFSIEISLDNIETEAVVAAIYNCPIILQTALEYQDDKTTIVGGNLIILPIKSGDINIQAAIRSQEDECSVVIGYPALPLGSY